MHVTGGLFVVACLYVVMVMVYTCGGDMVLLCPLEHGTIVSFGTIVVGTWYCCVLWYTCGGDMVLLCPLVHLWWVHGAVVPSGTPVVGTWYCCVLW